MRYSERDTAVTSRSTTKAMFRHRLLVMLLVMWELRAVASQQTAFIPSERCRYNDVGFLLDSSGSIFSPEGGVDNWRLMKEFVELVISRLDLGYDKNLVGMVQFSSLAQVVFNLSTYVNQSKALIYQTIDDLSSIPGSQQNTYTALGLSYMRTFIFGSTAGNRPDISNVAIVITDGQSNVNPSQTIPEARLLQNISTVFAVGVTNELNPSELASIATVASYSFISPNYSSLVDYVDTVIGLSCIPDLSAAPCRAVIDLAFIIGDPSSIQFSSAISWKRDILEFVNTVIRQFVVSESALRVGFVKFDTTAETVFNFTAYSNLNAMLPAIRAIPYTGGFMNVADGLLKAQNDLFRPTALGFRSSAAKIAILVVDKASNLQTLDTIPYAQSLRNAGVTIYAIGITTDIDIDELNSIASQPSSRYVYTVDNYPYLDVAANYILQQLCNLNVMTTTTQIGPTSTTSGRASTPTTSTATTRPPTSTPTTTPTPRTATSSAASSTISTTFSASSGSTTLPTGSASSSTPFTGSSTPLADNATSSSPFSSSTSPVTGSTTTFTGSASSSTPFTGSSTSTSAPFTGSSTPDTGSTTTFTGSASSSTPFTGSSTSTSAPFTGSTTPVTGSTTTFTGSASSSTLFTGSSTSTSTPFTGSSTPDTGSTTTFTGSASSSTLFTGSSTPLADNATSSSPFTGSTTPVTGSTTTFTGSASSSTLFTGSSTSTSAPFTGSSTPDTGSTTTFTGSASSSTPFTGSSTSTSAPFTGSSTPDTGSTTTFTGSASSSTPFTGSSTSTSAPFTGSSTPDTGSTTTFTGSASSSTLFTGSSTPLADNATSSSPFTGSSTPDTGSTTTFTGSASSSTLFTGSSTPLADNATSSSPFTGSSTPDTGSTTTFTGSASSSTPFTGSSTSTSAPFTGSSTPDTGSTTTFTGSASSSTLFTGSSTPLADNATSSSPFTGSSTPDTGSTTTFTGSASSSTPFTGSSTPSSTSSTSSGSTSGSVSSTVVSTVSSTSSSSSTVSTLATPTSSVSGSTFSSSATPGDSSSTSSAISTSTTLSSSSSTSTTTSSSSSISSTAPTSTTLSSSPSTSTTTSSSSSTSSPTPTSTTLSSSPSTSTTLSSSSSTSTTTSSSSSTSSTTPTSTTLSSSPSTSTTLSSSPSTSTTTSSSSSTSSTTPTSTTLSSSPSTSTTASSSSSTSSTTPTSTTLSSSPSTSTTTTTASTTPSSSTRSVSPPSSTTTTTLPPPGTCLNQADVLFAVDNSATISSAKYAQLISYIATVVSQLDIDSGKIRIGLVTFSQSSVVQFRLTSYRTRSDVVNAVRILPYSGYDTNTAAALRALRTDLLTDRRPGVPVVGIVMTNGDSLSTNDTLNEASLCRQSGIVMVTVSADAWMNMYVLSAIASYPYFLNTIVAPTYASLSSQQNYVSQLANIICNNVDECGGQPCQNGGTCQDQINYYYCVCPPLFGGVNCDLGCAGNSLDLVFALDSSGSIGSQSYEQMLQFVGSVILAMPVLSSQTPNGNQVGLIVFSTFARPEFYLNTFTDKKLMLAAVNVPYTRGSTNVADALRLVRETMFRTGQRLSAYDAMVIITDGVSDDPSATWQQAMLTRGANISIVTIGIGNNIDSSQLTSMASPNQSQTILLQPSMSNLLSGNLVNRLTSLLCNAGSQCQTNPCLNSGRCSSVIGGFYCECPLSFTGTTCERSCSGIIDLVIVLDSSGSIGEDRLKIVKRMIINTVQQLDVRLDRTRVGLVYWSDVGAIAFTMLSFNQTKQDVITAISRMPFVGNKTHTADGLRMLRQVFQTNAGDRPNVPNIAIVVTDGNSNIEPSQTLVEAATCRDVDIRMITVGVGDLVNVFELSAIASYPLAANMFYLPSTNNTDVVTAQLIRSTCDDVNECSSNLCQNGGTCQNNYAQYTCVCQPTYAGYNCERLCPRSWDVVLVLDLSGSTEDEYNLIIDFAKQTITGLDINSGRVRVGVVTFATNVTNVIYLNRYISSSSSLTNALNFIHDEGRTNTQAALNTMRLSLFTASNGDRPDVPNVAILVSDGNSNINETNTIPEANLAKSANIAVYSVVVTNQVNLDEMRGIASDPFGGVFVMPNSSYTASTVNEILTRLCS